MTKDKTNNYIWTALVIPLGRELGMFQDITFHPQVGRKFFCHYVKQETRYHTTFPQYQHIMSRSL